LAVEIIQMLKNEIQVTMGGSFHTGFKRSEIESLMNIFKVPDDERIDTLKKITFMEKIQLNELNKKE